MLQSIPGIVFAYCGFVGTMTVFILTGMVKTVPFDLEEAASIDGCSYEDIDPQSPPTPTQEFLKRIFAKEFFQKSLDNITMKG